MAARVYRDQDADLDVLRGKTCAVLGFGAQGRAQALNLKDSGLHVIIGLYPSSKSRAAARQRGLTVVDTAEAVRRGDVIFLALPDTKIPTIYNREIAPNLNRGKTLLFAHGFAIFYRTIVPPKGVDIIMVAPKGLGPMVRREFKKGRGAPALIAVHQNPTRKAKRTALAWARGIGCTRAGVIETSFKDETETDLFGEQTVLCGGMSALVRTGFETLVGAGYAPELAYFECLHELKFIVDLMHETGISGMRTLISETARWGDVTVGPQIIDRSVQRRMRDALKMIQSGKFAKEWIHETRSGQKRLSALLKAGKAHPIERVGVRLRALTSWAPPKNSATGENHSSQRKCSSRKRSRRAFASSLRAPPTAASFS